MSLLPVIAGLAAFGVAAIILMSGWRHHDARERYLDTTYALDDLTAAVDEFVLLNHRLPCPDDGRNPDGFEDRDPIAGLCLDETYGVLPWRSLNLPESAARDRWENRLSFRIQPELANADRVMSYASLQTLLGRLPLASPTTTADLNRLLTSTTSTTTGLVGGLLGTATGTVTSTILPVLGSGTGAVDLNNLPATLGLAVSSPVAGSGLDPATAATGGAGFVILSHGPTGYGAMQDDGTKLLAQRLTSTREMSNTTASGPFYDWTKSAGLAPENAQHFDDILAYRSVSALLDLLDQDPPRERITLNEDPEIFQLHFVRTTDQPPPGWTEPWTHPFTYSEPVLTQNAQNRPVLVFGDPVSAGSSLYQTMLTARIACAWVDYTFPFNARSFRIYYKFRFFPGEGSETSTGTADGYTLAFVPGARDLRPGGGQALCGNSQEGTDLGFVGGTLLNPKFAIEFDIYRRDSYDPAYNHVAVLTRDSTLHGTNGMPDCSSSGVRADGFAPCVYRDSGSAPNKIWLEDRTLSVGETMGLLATPITTRTYPVRVEAHRLCNSNCSVCGNQATSAGKILVRGWVDCQAASCADISVPFAGGSGSGRQVSACFPEPSFAGQPDFSNVKIGFTAATGAARTGVIISDIDLGVFPE
jgi:hypothetical protein